MSANSQATQVNAELPVELLDQVKAFAESRGQRIRGVIAEALRRHLAYPPPVPEPAPEPPPVPLPDAAPAASVKRRKSVAKSDAK